MKAVVAAVNQEKALVGAFSVITNLRMELFEALVRMTRRSPDWPRSRHVLDRMTRDSDGRQDDGTTLGISLLDQ